MLVANCQQFRTFEPEMKKELSILIPVYNADCRQQVTELLRQASVIDGLEYEVIVADDESPDKELTALCREISQWKNCRFIERDHHTGRACMRNFLARQARYEWLLFLDCDMGIKAGFIQRYLECDGSDVIDGGVSIGKGPDNNLRYLYEKACEARHSAEERSRQPFHHFHTANFLVRRNILLANPFDERYRNYGYEDVFFGKQLAKQHIKITHIDNPAGFDTFEDNPHFVQKTEEGLRTLHTFRADLKGYSNMLTFVDGIHISLVKRLIVWFHRLSGPFERRRLCGSHPSLRIFNLYKLGYYLTLTKND